MFDGFAQWLGYAIIAVVLSLGGFALLGFLAKRMGVLVIFFLFIVLIILPSVIPGIIAKLRAFVGN